MLNRLILKVTKFQFPPPKRLGTVVKNVLGGHHGPPCQIGLKRDPPLDRYASRNGLTIGGLNNFAEH